jgi:hypothetical protein
MMASLLRRRSAWNWSTRCKWFRSILAMASPTIPVAIMTYGSADMMGVPWETIVKIYAKRLGSRTFETLEHYAKDFLTFVEEATTLFPAENQKSWVADVVGDVWSGLYQGKLQERMKKTPNASDVIGTAALLDLIHKDHKDWAHYPNLEEIGADYGARVLQTYADVINQVEAEIFKGIKLTPQIRHDLRETVRFMFEKKWFHPNVKSGVVIAGIGEEEPFPTVLVFDIGTVAANKLRYTKANEGRVRFDDDAYVMPFAQTQTIDMIFRGIHPALKTELIDNAENWLPGVGTTKKGPKTERINNLKENVDNVLEEMSKRHYRPLIEAVAALSRQDLATMAHSLVSLTAFLMRMDVDQSETVAEPIDVSVLSKGDGFIWIKHKDLVRQAAGLAL